MQAEDEGGGRVYSDALVCGLLVVCLLTHEMAHEKYMVKPEF
jgi:hypothetical protein